MRKSTKMMMMTVVATLCFPLVSVEASKKIEEKEKVIVMFKHDNAPTNDIAVKAQGDVSYEFKSMDGAVMELPKSSIEALKKNPNVLSVEKDIPVHLLDSPSVKPLEIKKDRVHIQGNASVKAQTQDWGINAIKAPLAWSNGLTGTGVKVLVADTGVEYYHSDLHIAGGVSFVTEDVFCDDSETTICQDSSYDDYHGHGTHVSGIIAAQNNSLGSVGVAPNVSLYAAKVFDRNGEGSLSTIVSALDWAIAQKMDIVNLSLGSQGDSPSFKAVMDKAYAAGILIVGAAGNDYTDPISEGGCNNSSTQDCVDYPARYDSVISVAATTNSNTHASFSSTGTSVEVSAPGQNIYSTYLENSYGYMSGTSMATPYTTGVLALYKQANPTFTAADLRSALQKSAVDLGTKGRDVFFGYGLIQAPSSSSTPSVPIETINTYITTYETLSLYDQPSTLAKAVSAVGAQTLYAYRKQGQWYEIQTWLGKKWIKPTLFIEGVTTKATKKVTFTASTTLYTLPLTSKTTNTLIAPQTLLSYEEWNGWYKVDTSYGYRWIKPINPTVQTYQERVRLTSKTDLYNSMGSGKLSTALGPQTVTAISKYREWYQINTWLGPKWIKPTKAIEGTIEPFTQPLYLITNTPATLLPFSGEPVKMNLTPQRVQPFEKWGNWYHIRTWKGDMWIKPILTKVTKTNQVVFLPTITPAKNLPFEDEVAVTSFAPQWVHSFEQTENWYHISTWKGPLWVAI